jgi:hypothetical protein
MLGSVQTAAASGVKERDLSMTEVMGSSRFPGSLVFLAFS